MKHLSFKGFFLSSLFTALFATSFSYESAAQCNGTEMLMSKMGRLGYNYTDYSWNPNSPTDRNVPCEIKIHSEQASYIDLEIRFVASARLSIYDENDNLVKIIDGYGWNQVPDVNLGISGSEVTIVYESLIMSQYELTGFLGSYDSDGISAGEEILECSGALNLYGSSGIFETDARKIVMEGQGMSTPCEWVIESENATWIKIDFKEFYSAEVEVLDENNNVVFNPRFNGRRRDFYSVTVPGSKATIRHVESLSNMSFWHGMYTSDGVDDQCIFENIVFNSDDSSQRDLWSNIGGSWFNGNNGDYFLTLSNSNSNPVPSASSPTYNLQGASMIDIEFESSPRFQYYLGFILEISLDGGLTYSVVNSYDPPADYPQSSYFSVDYNHVESYSGLLSDQVVFRFSNKYGASGSVSFSKIKITAYYDVDNSSIAVDLDLPSRFDLTDDALSLISSYPSMSFELNGNAVTEIDPASLGIGVYKLNANWETSSNCRLQLSKDIIVLDENNICDNEVDIGIPDVIYSHALPFIWDNSNIDGLITGSQIEYNLDDSQCSDELIISKDFENGQFPSELTKFGTANVLYNWDLSGQYLLSMNSGSSIMTQSLDFSAIERFTVSFDMISINQTYNGGELIIDLSIDGGANYSTVLLDMYEGTDYTNYQSRSVTKTIDGISYGDNCIIRIRNISNYGQRIRIDNLNISTSTCSPSAHTYSLVDSPPGEYTIEYLNINATGCNVFQSQNIQILESDYQFNDDGCGLSCDNGQIIISTDFETNGTFFPVEWQDGGSDAAIYSSSTYASSGSYSLQLRDNSGIYSSVTSKNLQLSSADGLRISFSLYPVSFEANEDFFIKLSTNGGSSFQTIGTYVVNEDFYNYQRKTINLEYFGDLSDNTRLRIESSASNNYDKLYFDDIVISTCSNQELPQISFNNPVAIQMFDEPVVLEASPSGGVFFGEGTTNGIFNPIDVGEGQYDISYYYEVGANCNATLTVPVTVINSTSTTVSLGCPLDCANGTVILESDFEGNGYYFPSAWIDGGSDASITAINASSGTFCAKLRDNSGQYSSMTTTDLNLSNVQGISMSFSLYASSFEANEDFFIKISTNGGSSFQTIETYTVNQDFNNNQRKTITLEHFGAMTANTRIRIESSASDNNDALYVDDVVIRSCSQSEPPEVSFSLPSELMSDSPIWTIADASPEGGEFAPPVIFDEMISPANLGKGAHEITYTYSVNDNCYSSLSKSLLILEGDITFGFDETQCFSDERFILTAFPSGGDFTGSDQFGNSVEFDGSNYFVIPDKESVFELNYSVNTDNGMQVMPTILTFIAPLASFNIAPEFTLSDAPVELVGFPSGGLFSGEGVNGNTFDPGELSGGGRVEITYIVANNIGCSVEFSQTVFVTTGEMAINYEISSHDDGSGSGSIDLSLEEVVSSYYVDLIDDGGVTVFTESESNLAGSGVRNISIEDLYCGTYSLIVGTLPRGSENEEIYEILIETITEPYYTITVGDDFVLDLTCENGDSECNSGVLTTVSTGTQQVVNFTGSAISISGITELSSLELRWFDENGGLARTKEVYIEVEEALTCRQELLSNNGFVCIKNLTIVPDNPPGFNSTSAKKRTGKNNSELINTQIQYELKSGMLETTTIGQLITNIATELDIVDSSFETSIFLDVDCNSSDISAIDILGQNGIAVFLDFEESKVCIKSVVNGEILGDPILWLLEYIFGATPEDIQAYEEIKAKAKALLNTEFNILSHTKVFNSLFSSPLSPFGAIGDLIKFIRNSWTVYDRCVNSNVQLPPGSSIEPLLVPLCLWYPCSDDTFGLLASGELVEPFTAGIIDGIAETIEGIYGIGKFALAWTPVFPGGGFNSFYLSVEAFNIRQQTMVVMHAIGFFFNPNTRVTAIDLAIQKLGPIFNEYVKNVVGTDCEAQYLQGKLILAIADIIFGSKGARFIAVKGSNAFAKVVTRIEKVLNSPLNLSSDLGTLLVRTPDGDVVVKKGDKIVAEVEQLVDNADEVKEVGEQTRPRGFKIKIIETIGLEGITIANIKNLIPVNQFKASNHLYYGTRNLKKYGIRINFNSVNDPIIKKLLDEIDNGLDIEDLEFNLPSGSRTEALTEIVFRRQGYESLYPVHIEGNKGFDGVFVKYNESRSEIIDMIIPECKQTTSNGSMKMAKGNPATLLPDQGSDEWISHVVNRMIDPSKPQSIQEKGNLILEYLGDGKKITKVIAGVHNGELIIGKIK